MPFIIGTAGHIDHGKTSLIKALTGFAVIQVRMTKRWKACIRDMFGNIFNRSTIKDGRGEFHTQLFTCPA